MITKITNSGFAYDNNGNLIQGKVKGVIYQYPYDKANRLTQVKDASGKEIAFYTYDAQGQRLIKTANGVTQTAVDLCSLLDLGLSQVHPEKHQITHLK